MSFSPRRLAFSLSLILSPVTMSCRDDAATTAKPFADASLRVTGDAATLADARALPTAPGADAAGATADAAAPVGDATLLTLDATQGAGGTPDADVDPGADAHFVSADARPGPRVHPEGYDSSRVHGPELRRGVGDCRTCHGVQLEGGRGPSCDACHPAGWRTDCVFCHGGTDTQTGAPPRDLDAVNDRAAQRFAPHTEHTTVRNHAAWDCTQCHRKPVDVMSVGHVFDDTPGVAEVDFAGGIAAGATWDANGQCGNVYCHGNGRVPGAIAHTAARPTCDTCHVWFGLGGRHLQHFVRLVACVSCHGDTADANQMITGPDSHVNGTIDVVFDTPDIAFANGSCNGDCHGEGHNDRGW
jgi:hypothetical protein